MRRISIHSGKLFVVPGKKIPKETKDLVVLSRPGDVDINKGLPEVYNLYANGVYNTPIYSLYLSQKPTLLGRAKDLNKEQMDLICEKNYYGYKDYNAIPRYEMPFEDITLSYQSFLAFNAIKPDDILLFQIKP